MKLATPPRRAVRRHMAAKKHGGRRFGLEKKGAAPRLIISLTQADLERLDELAELWACSRAEVIRRLIRAA